MNIYKNTKEVLEVIKTSFHSEFFLTVDMFTWPHFSYNTQTILQVSDFGCHENLEALSLPLNILFEVT